MRECWINVYTLPYLDPDGAPQWLASPQETRAGANRAATGFRTQDGKSLRAAGVGYRLHVRLKPGPEEYARLKQDCPAGVTMAQWERFMGRR